MKFRLILTCTICVRLFISIFCYLSHIFNQHKYSLTSSEHASNIYKTTPETIAEAFSRLMLMAHGPSFLYKKFVRETWHKKLVYKSHTEPPKFLVRETWPMTETIKHFKFYFFSGQHSIINKMAKKTKKDETTNNNQQQNIVKKTKRISNQQRRSISIT